MDDNIFNFEKLSVYQKALSFADFVYGVTADFPNDERFALTDQFSRAAISIALNIAEGYGMSKLEFKRYLKISKGSIRECVAITSLSRLRKYLDSQHEEKIRSDCAELSRMISGLVRSLSVNSKLRTPNSGLIC